eukprot:4632548-Pyramimonas_sp.AAC.1
MLDIRLSNLDTSKTSVSIENSSTHPHARHPSGRPGQVKTSLWFETSSTNPHARYLFGQPGGVTPSVSLGTSSRPGHGKTSISLERSSEF